MKYKLNGASQKSYEGTVIQHGETLELADGAGAIAFGKLRYWLMKLGGTHLYFRCKTAEYVRFHDSIVERYFTKLS